MPPLNLTAREAAALDRLLDAYLVTESDAEPIVGILRPVKAKLEHLPQDHAGRAGWRGVIAPCGCTLPGGPFCDYHRVEFFGEEKRTDADRFLMLIRDNPTLLPAAPNDSTAAMEHRRRDEVHACLRCGGRAQCAVIAGTSLGSRWLDLCAACMNWLQTNATPAPLWKPAR